MTEDAQRDTGEIRVVFEYDSSRNVVFTEDIGEVRTEADVDAFLSRYVEYFEHLGTRAYVVSNIDRLLIHDTVAGVYGKRAERTISQHILGFARWGTQSRSRMMLRAASLTAGLPANIYSDREEALRAIERMKAQNGAAAGPPKPQHRADQPPAIRVVFDYDPATNIVFTEDHGEIRTEADVDDFLARYSQFFRKLGRKAYVVSNIDNLLVRSEIADYYGRKAEETVVKHILGFARWGTNNWARLTVRTTSYKANIPANIFDSREQAVRAIEAMR